LQQTSFSNAHFKVGKGSLEAYMKSEKGALSGTGSFQVFLMSGLAGLATDIGKAFGWL
jgi:hypothetical protein